MVSATTGVRGRVLVAEDERAVRSLRTKVDADPPLPSWLVTVRGQGYTFTRRRERTGRDSGSGPDPV
jgi:hypothetical protein